MPTLVHLRENNLSNLGDGSKGGGGEGKKVGGGKRPDEARDEWWGATGTKM